MAVQHTACANGLENFDSVPVPVRLCGQGLKPPRLGYTRMGGGLGSLSNVMV